MDLDNLIYEGTGFVYIGGDAALYSLRTAIISIMSKRYFEEMGNPFQGTLFTTMEFFTSFRPDDFATIKTKLKRKFRLISEGQYAKEAHYSYLKQRIPWLPHDIEISLRAGKFRDRSGLIVHIVVKPSLYFQCIQLGWLPERLLPTNYEKARDECNRFIIDMFETLGAEIADKPHPRTQPVGSISEKLLKIKCDTVAKLLERAKRKIDTNDPSGIDDLRGAIEHLLFELVKKTGKTPERLDKPEKNLNILKEAGIISTKYYEFIKPILIGRIYAYLSESWVHSREETNFEQATAIACLNVTESIFTEFINILIQKGLT